jgi:long-chain acyl-CoA synthetase
VFKKFSLGAYKWTVYEQVYERVNNFSAGLASLGIEPEQKVVLFAETRPEWIISAFGCFRLNLPVVTLYSTLGIDALAFGINQTNASYLITSGDQLSKVQKIIHKTPKLTHVIVLSDKYTEASVVSFKAKCPSLKVFTLNELEETGKDCGKISEKYKKPNKNNIAVIMYTSGSTGRLDRYCLSFSSILDFFEYNSEKAVCFKFTIAFYLPNKVEY